MAKHLLVFKPSKWWSYFGGALGIIADDVEQAKQVISDYNKGIADREAEAVAIGNRFYWDAHHPIKQPLIMSDLAERGDNDLVNENWVFLRCYELAYNETPRLEFIEWHDG